MTNSSILASCLAGLIVFGVMADPVMGQDYFRARVYESLQALQANDRDEPKAAVEDASDRSSEEGFRAIVSLERDGTNPKFVAAVPGMIATTDPMLSPGGKYMALCGMTEFDDVRKSRVFVTAMNGPFQGTYRQLAYGNTPSWSPDGKRITYMLNGSNPAGARAGAWIMNADGSDKEWLGIGWYPRWSPDGKRIVAHDYRNASLVVFDLETGRSHNLFSSDEWRLVLYGASWSPDSQRVIFVGRHQGEEHLVSMNVDAGEASIQTLYTNHESDQRLLGPPSYSPDGQQIVLIIEDSKSSRGSRNFSSTYLYSMSAKIPSAPRLLEPSKVGNINRFATWYPDSSRILFSSERPLDSMK